MQEIKKNNETAKETSGLECGLEELQTVNETFKEEEEMEKIKKIEATEASAVQERVAVEAPAGEAAAAQECAVTEALAGEAAADQECAKEEAKINYIGDWAAIKRRVLGVGDKPMSMWEFLTEYPEMEPVIEYLRKQAIKNPTMGFNEFCVYNLFNRKGYRVSNDGYIRYVTDKLKAKEAGKAFRISDLIKNADTGHYSVALEIFTPYDGVRRLEGVPMSITVKRLETLLCDNGCIVTDAKLTHEYFRQQTDIAMKGYTQRPVYVVGKDGVIIDAVWSAVLGNIPMLSMVHSERIGWDTDKITNKVVFKGKNIYSADETYSDYQGNFMIGEQGDYDAYLDMLKEEVVGNVNLEATLSFGSSATLLKFMNETFGLNLLNPIVHMYGDSTSGKTTALILMVSFGGNPVRNENPSKEALFTTFNGTADSLLKVIGNNNGFLFGIDELSMSKMSAKEKERILYALTGGLDKKRLLRDGSGLQCGVSFATTILTNGEETIVPHNGVKQGFFNRVFEFACIAWTKSAENANEIQTVCKKNYGFVTPMLAQYLLRLDETQRNQLLEHYNEWKQKFIDRAKAEYVYEQYTERLSETLALFMVSLDCFGAVTGLGLHYDEVFGFLFDNILVKEGERATLGLRAYRHLLRTYNDYHDDFCKELDYKSKAIGIIVTRGQYRKVKIEGYGEFETSQRIGLTKEQAEEIFVKRGNFANVKIVMDELHKMGALLTKDKARRTAPPFKGNRLMVEDGYQIYIPEDASFLDCWAINDKECDELNAEKQAESDAEGLGNTCEDESSH